MKTLHCTRLSYHQPLAHQGQSSSSPHPASILPPPASCTFRDTPRSLLDLSQSRKTPSLESPLPPLPPFPLLLLSRGQTEPHLRPLLPSTSLRPPTPHCFSRPQIWIGPLPAGHTDPCWTEVVKKSSSVPARSELAGRD